jgi:chromosome partitioning protein
MKYELEKLAGEYTHILIDNVPLVGSIQTLQSTTSADDLIIPMHADALTLQGLANLREGLIDIRQLNPSLNIAGILLVKHHYTVNERVYSYTIREWAEEMGTSVFDTFIREAIALQTVQGNRENLYAAAPDENPTLDYLEFIDEYLGKAN